MEISTPDELGGQVFEEPLIQWVGSVRIAGLSYLIEGLDIGHNVGDFLIR